MSIIITGTQKQARDHVANKLATDDNWLIRGLLAIYERQTADEQRAEHTKHRNAIGFNGVDSQILSSFAKQVQQWQKTPEKNRRFDSPLSPRQIVLTRQKMAKYAGQLVIVAREKATEEAVAAIEDTD